MCKNIQVQVKEKSIDTSVSCGDLYVPVGMSYSCQKGTFKQTTYKNKTATIRMLKFDGFQVQAFANTSAPVKKFAPAYDCIGFFSIPIFMGLITVGVLLAILFGGIMATMSIMTMDRFDDPKGPGIQIGGSN